MVILHSYDAAHNFRAISIEFRIQAIYIALHVVTNRFAGHKIRSLSHCMWSSVTFAENDDHFPYLTTPYNNSEKAEEKSVSAHVS